MSVTYANILCKSSYDSSQQRRQSRYIKIPVSYVNFNLLPICTHNTKYQAVTDLFIAHEDDIFYLLVFLIGCIIIKLGLNVVMIIKKAN